MFRSRQSSVKPLLKLFCIQVMIQPVYRCRSSFSVVKFQMIISLLLFFWLPPFSRSCWSRSCLPIINWDGSVSLKHGIVFYLSLSLSKCATSDAAECMVGWLIRSPNRRCLGIILCHQSRELLVIIMHIALSSKCLGQYLEVEAFPQQSHALFLLRVHKFHLLEGLRVQEIFNYLLTKNRKRYRPISSKHNRLSATDLPKWFKNSWGII